MDGSGGFISVKFEPLCPVPNLCGSRFRGPLPIHSFGLAVHRRFSAPVKPIKVGAWHVATCFQYRCSSIGSRQESTRARTIHRRSRQSRCQRKDPRPPCRLLGRSDCPSGTVSYVPRETTCPSGRARPDRWASPSGQPDRRHLTRQPKSRELIHNRSAITH